MLHSHSLQKSLRCSPPLVSGSICKMILGENMQFSLFFLLLFQFVSAELWHSRFQAAAEMRHKSRAINADLHVGWLLPPTNTWSLFGSCYGCCCFTHGPRFTSSSAWQFSEGHSDLLGHLWCWTELWFLRLNKCELSQRVPAVKGDEEQTLTKVRCASCTVQRKTVKTVWNRAELWGQTSSLTAERRWGVLYSTDGWCPHCATQRASVSLKHSVMQNMQPKILQKGKLKDGKSTKY